jgi:hypothetical protein
MSRPLSMQAITWPSAPVLKMEDYDCGATDGMICTESISTQRKPGPLPLCPPQIPHNMIRAWTWASAVGKWWLLELWHGFRLVQNIIPLAYICRGHTVAWLKHYAISQKVVSCNPSSHIRPWGLLSLWHKQVPNWLGGGDFGEYSMASMSGWQPHNHLCAYCRDNVGSSTSHILIGVHGNRPMIKTRSFYWAQLNRFYSTTSTRGRRQSQFPKHRDL